MVVDEHIGDVYNAGDFPSVQFHQHLQVSLRERSYSAMKKIEFYLLTVNATLPLRRDSVSLDLIDGKSNNLNVTIRCYHFLNTVQRRI